MMPSKHYRPKKRQRCPWMPEKPDLQASAFNITYGDGILRPSALINQVGGAKDKLMTMSQECKTMNHFNMISTTSWHLPPILS